MDSVFGCDRDLLERVVGVCLGKRSVGVGRVIEQIPLVKEEGGQDG
jgi:hypothetical protein